jgi:hypothetical protein
MPFKMETTDKILEAGAAGSSWATKLKSFSASMAYTKQTGMPG